MSNINQNSSSETHPIITGSSPSNCETLDSSNNCLQCFYGYINYNSVCFCPSTFIEVNNTCVCQQSEKIYSLTHECLTCTLPHCLQCDTINHCIQCDSSTTLVSGKCILDQSNISYSLIQVIIIVVLTTLVSLIIYFIIFKVIKSKIKVSPQQEVINSSVPKQINEVSIKDKNYQVIQNLSSSIRATSARIPNITIISNMTMSTNLNIRQTQQNNQSQYSQFDWQVLE